jgi:hypothetical protein
MELTAQTATNSGLRLTPVAPSIEVEVMVKINPVPLGSS